MKKKLSLLTALSAILAVVFLNSQSQAEVDTPNVSTDENSKTAVFAGGCFWCIESDFEKLDGVVSAVSGYTGGDATTANYKTVSYTETGHFEAVEVNYNPEQVSYSELVEYFWRHIDPTDPDGQFCDKGSSYRSAIFYGDEQEREIVEASLEKLQQSKPFEDDIVTTIAAAKPFYDAETYHQDYYKKNPVRYRVYRTGCGRDRRVKKLWGE